MTCYILMYYKTSAAILVDNIYCVLHCVLKGPTKIWTFAAAGVCLTLIEL